ncbi:MAG: hypothetical protein H6557_21875 [Lewinellaceae bacterium]|nr:hypothetical protein [Phaeodactylibacter sp.]MCB9039271.1 hypothetical protein [Lewinellaceae bacterium]
MMTPLVFSPVPLLLCSFVFITSCVGQNQTGLPKDSMVERKTYSYELNPFEQQYKNVVGKWALASSDKKIFDTVEFSEEGEYLLKTDGTKDSGKWRIVDVHHVS